MQFHPNFRNWARVAEMRWQDLFITLICIRRPTRYPDYYNGKLFIYDWIRGWIKVVTMQPNGDFEQMEPFMPHIVLHNCIDMEAGPDGKIYLLEYGTAWFQKNPDAGLSVLIIMKTLQQKLQLRR